MHYYQFNIGDYAKATRHLSNNEDLAYRRLIELYYDTEKPLIKDVKKLSRLINMRENVEDIKSVLDDFFIESKDGYTQNRIEREIVNYHSKADKARANGKLGGRPKKPNAKLKKPNPEPKITQPVNLANPDLTGLKANQEPLTNNHKPLTILKEKTSAFAKPTREDVNKFAFDNKLNLEGFFDYYESNGWKVGKNAMKKWDAAARGWSKRQGGYSNQQKNVEYDNESTDWAVDALNGNSGIMGFD